MSRQAPALTTAQGDVPSAIAGVIGFDVDRVIRGSGPRMLSYLVNALSKPIGADSKRTDFALAA